LVGFLAIADAIDLVLPELIPSARGIVVVVELVVLLEVVVVERVVDGLSLVSTGEVMTSGVGSVAVLVADGEVVVDEGEVVATVVVVVVGA
jgi:hypothetical protein